MWILLFIRIARGILLNLTFISFYTNTITSRIQSETHKKLKALHIIKEKHHAIMLNSTFRTSFRNALTGSDGTSSFGIPCDTEDKHKVNIAFLDAHATSRWESILHYMVGTQETKTPNEGVLSLLRHGGLMDGTRITNAGFQFLLQDVNAQIWTLLLQYLNMAEKLQMDPVDVLNFIFMLGSLELGKDYSLSALSGTQVQMLEDLRDYGIVYQRKSTSRRFYPTKLATTLTSEATPSVRSASMSMEAATNVSTSSGGFIILETNFRLYAYTDSPLQIAVLNLFVSLKSRFANMVTGNITRESVRSALSNGIKAEQIITYLTVHAHPQMQKTDSILPPTVVDQIRLWQIEMDRIKSVEGYLFTHFSTFDEYKMVVNYANQLGVVVWQSPTKRRFFVTKEGNAQLVDYVNRKIQEKKTNTY